MSSGSSSTTNNCGPNEVSITLAPLFQSDFQINKHSGYRIRVEVTQACGMSDKIFRYYRGPIDPATGVQTEQFTGICSLVDLEVLPADAPNPTDCPQAFRLNYMDIVVETMELAYEVWEIVKEEVGQLVSSVIKSNDLAAQSTYYVG